MIDPIDRYFTIAERGHKFLSVVPGFDAFVAFVATTVMVVVGGTLSLPLFILGFIIGGLRDK